MIKSTENVSEMMKEIKKHFLFRAKQEEKQIEIVGDDNITLLCDRDWLTAGDRQYCKKCSRPYMQKADKIQIEYKQFPSAVQIIVKDNGSGIHPEDLHHIFKRFYRSRFSKDTQGVGLGLPLAKTIIEEHSGSIEVDSELGKGTTFIINFLIPTKL